MTEVEADALRLLTRNEGTPYLEYVAKIKGNVIAAKVKVADLRHNADLTRIKNPTAEDLERVAKYRRALNILERGDSVDRG